MAEKTLTVYLSGYDATDYAYASAEGLENPIGAGVDATTYATINLTTGSNAETYVYYTFDLTEIPQGAEIVSISCRAKGLANIRSWYGSASVQLYSGATAKGTASSLSTTATTQTLTAGTWTTEELADCRLRVYAKRGTMGTSSDYYIQFYGAELTITYDAPEVVPIVGNVTVAGAAKTIAGGAVNVGGVWKTVAKSYVNIGGVWKPTYSYKTPTYTWKKYAVVTTTADGWKWSDATRTVAPNSATGSTAQGYNDPLTPTYSDGQLTNLTGVSSEPCTAQEMYNALNNGNGDDYYRFLSPGSAWSAGSYTPSENFVYKVDGYGADGNGTATSFDVRVPVYSAVTTQTRGEYIEDVTGTSRSEYPENGIQGGYWYVRQ